MIRRLTADLLLHTRAEVGESPVIAEGGSRLLWVDLTAGKLHSWAFSADEHSTVAIGATLGAVALRAEGPGVAAAFGHGLGYIEGADAVMVVPVVPAGTHRMNDAKVDSMGRLWAGSTHAGFVAGQGAVHVWEGDDRVRTVLDGLTLPNGLGWTADDRSMVLADSMLGTVFAADYDTDSGVLGGLRPLVTVTEGMPDGLAVDVDGGVWVAIWGRGEVHRYTPEGALDTIVELPVSRPTSCAFGRAGDLIITSARHGLDGEQLSLEPLAGSVFSVATTTTGVPVMPFGG